MVASREDFILSAVRTEYAGTLAVLSRTVSFGRINSTSSFSSSTLSRPNRRVTPLWLFVTAGGRDASRSGDRARVRWLRSIEKRLHFFVAVLVE